MNDSNDVTCLMLATMSPELQKQFMDMEAYETHLKELFQEQARHERFVTTKALTSCKMAPGTSISAHVLKMKGYQDSIRMGFLAHLILNLMRHVNLSCVEK